MADRVISYRPIVNYIPKQVLEYLAQQCEEHKRSSKPLFKYIETPRYSSHKVVTMFADVKGKL